MKGGSNWPPPRKKLLSKGPVLLGLILVIYILHVRSQTEINEPIINWSMVFKNINKFYSAKREIFLTIQSKNSSKGFP